MLDLLLPLPLGPGFLCAINASRSLFINTSAAASASAGDIDLRTSAGSLKRIIPVPLLEDFVGVICISLAPFTLLRRELLRALSTLLLSDVVAL